MGSTGVLVMSGPNRTSERISVASEQATQKAPGPAIAAPSIGGKDHAAPPPVDPSPVETSGVDDSGAALVDEPAGSAVDWSSWSNLWQVPVLVISVALIAIGLYASIKPPNPNDFDGAMKQIDQFIAAGQFDEARKQLHEMVEPNLHLATPMQQGRYHAICGDLLGAILTAVDSREVEQWQHVAAEFRQAEQLGLELDVARMERWAHASIAASDFDGARQRLTRMDELQKHAGHDDASAVDSAHASRNRVFRRLVDATLGRPETQPDELMQTLTEYRADSRLRPDDELWAIARQADIRLQQGQSSKAIENLLVEMRRMESHGVDIPRENIGQLYTLLGRASFDLGDYTRAVNHLQRALDQYDGAEPARGEALVLLGRIDQAQSNPDAAIEKYYLVVRDCIGTPAYLPGLLGRAETQSILGEHEQSIEDYQALRESLSKSNPRRDINAELVAQSLCNRHDAALAMGKLDQAIVYATIAESLFKAEEVPGDVLVRLASTHRQIADNLVAGALSPPSDESHDDAGLSETDRRHLANGHYEKAGEFYLRHTSSHRDESIGEADWFSSLWLAADSYDRGGRQDLAVRNFARYLQASPVDDARRAETLYRLGRAHHAELNFEEAIKAYEQVVSENPRSTSAAHAHVPLARCYLAVNRRPEAEQQLNQVLSGDRLLNPDAEDYRDALIELGTIAYENSQCIDAIERFTEAMERYPDDPRRLEILFRLADSYRANASGLDERLSQSPPLPPAEQNRFRGLRSEHLQKSLELFAQVSDSHSEAVAGGKRSERNDLEQDMIRRAHLYQADCAFHLGEYQSAIELYDRAARLYSAHASSMYALVQIVNCYTALSDADRAVAAHHRALVRLKQLPDPAFESLESLMDRAAWEQWLDNSPVGPGHSAAANASNG